MNKQTIQLYSDILGSNKEGVNYCHSAQIDKYHKHNTERWNQITKEYIQYAFHYISFSKQAKDLCY